MNSQIATTSAKSSTAERASLSPTDSQERVKQTVNSQQLTVNSQQSTVNS